MKRAVTHRYLRGHEEPRCLLHWAAKIKILQRLAHRNTVRSTVSQQDNQIVQKQVYFSYQDPVSVGGLGTMVRNPVSEQLANTVYYQKVLF